MISVVGDSFMDYIRQLKQKKKCKHKWVWFVEHIEWWLEHYFTFLQTFYPRRRKWFLFVGEFSNKWSKCILDFSQSQFKSQSSLQINNWSHWSIWQMRFWTSEKLNWSTAKSRTQPNLIGQVLTLFFYRNIFTAQN